MFYPARHPRRLLRGELVIDARNKTTGAQGGIPMVLIGSEHLTPVELSGIEQIEIDNLYLASPASVLPGPAALVVFE
jgi:hypothetical protein